MTTLEIIDFFIRWFLILLVFLGWTTKHEMKNDAFNEIDEQRKKEDPSYHRGQCGLIEHIKEDAIIKKEVNKKFWRKRFIFVLLGAIAGAILATLMAFYFYKWGIVNGRGHLTLPSNWHIDF